MSPSAGQRQRWVWSRRGNPAVRRVPPPRAAPCVCNQPRRNMFSILLFSDTAARIIESSNPFRQPEGTTEDGRCCSRCNDPTCRLANWLTERKTSLPQRTPWPKLPEDNAHQNAGVPTQRIGESSQERRATAGFPSTGRAKGSAYAGTRAQLDISITRVERRRGWKLKHNPLHLGRR
jgi:hypothetical protein